MKKILISLVLFCIANIFCVSLFAQNIWIPYSTIYSTTPSTNFNVLIAPTLSYLSPQSQLHVVGDIRIPKTNRIIFGNNGSGEGEWIRNDPGTGFGLLFFGNSQKRMHMTNNGLFGIGDNIITPSHRLHVVENGTTDPVCIRTLQLATDSFVVTVNNAGVLHQRRFNFNAGVTNNCTWPNFVTKVGTSSNILVCSQIFDNGTSVGISHTGPFNYTNLNGARTGVILPPSTGIVRLHVNGIIRSLANIVTSDQSLKSNITEIKSPIEIINSLNGKIFKWNEVAQKTLMVDKGFHFGFIAQDVQKTLPEVIIEDEKGVLGMNYTEIIPILVEAVKEQQKTILELKNRIEKLEGRIK